MSRITINDTWSWWFKRERTINGYKNELEGIERLIVLEKKYPTKGEQWLRQAIKKRMILRYKIKQLEGVAK